MTHVDQLILAIDVGNTRIKCGLLEMSGSALPVCRHSAFGLTDENISWQTVSSWAGCRELNSISAVLAGSHPERVQQIIGDWPEDGPSVRQVVDCHVDLPLTVNLPEPQKVGIDRLLNAVAANQIRPEGKSVIIVDTGTATTVDVVSAAGEFEGGAILPGLELSSRALHQYTALLPSIDVRALDGTTPNPLGRDTTGAIQSGLFWGQVGAVKELILRLSEQFAGAVILMTGGGGELLTPYITNAQYEPHLSLQGLALAADKRE